MSDYVLGRYGKTLKFPPLMGTEHGFFTISREIRKTSNELVLDIYARRTEINSHRWKRVGSVNLIELHT